MVLPGDGSCGETAEAAEKPCDGKNEEGAATVGGATLSGQKSESENWDEVLGSEKEVGEAVVDGAEAWWS